VKLISVVDKILSIIEATLITTFLTVMVMLAFLQVVLRNLFSFGFLWADPLLRYLVVWVGFLGAALATKEGKHLGIDFLNRYLQPRLLHAARTTVDSFAAIVAFLLTRAAFQFLLEGITADEMDLFGLHKRLYFGVIPCAFGLITLHFAIRVVLDLHAFFTDKAEVAQPHSEKSQI